LGDDEDEIDEDECIYLVLILKYVQ